MQVCDVKVSDLAQVSAVERLGERAHEGGRQILANSPRSGKKQKTSYDDGSRHKCHLNGLRLTASQEAASFFLHQETQFFLAVSILPAAFLYCREERKKMRPGPTAGYRFLLLFFSKRLQIEKKGGVESKCTFFFNRVPTFCTSARCTGC